MHKCVLPLLVVLAAGCAARGPSRQAIADLAKADALLRDGCYACLKDALALFRTHQSAKGILDASVLIAVREKELGIPADTSLPAGPMAEAVALVIGEVSGLDPEQRSAYAGRARPPVEKDNAARRALDPLFGSDLAATYVALTIDCESPRLIDGVDVPALTATFASVPLMRFRLARCGRPGSAPDLAALRASDPRWVDTLFWEGRRALIGSPTTGIDFPKALTLFGAGRAALPASLPITMAWANTNMSAEEFEAALSGFDDVLAAHATHRDALIGRVTALSYLLRHSDAILSATQLIDLGTWHTGDAYYWRAWNRYYLKDYEPAWQDVESAMKGLSNSRVYMLAGLIAYARTDLPIAVERFDRAYELDSSACDATWMSGLASIDQQQLAVAAPKFTRGMSCYVSSAASLREDLGRVEQQIAARGTPAEPRELRQIARFRRDAEDADERSAQSAFNAAQCYARIGQRSMALNLVNVAIEHPRMKEKAESLKAAIEKLPQ